MVFVKELYRETSKYAGKEIEVAGWVRTARESKVFYFARDI